jgi:hypothetical protein
MVNRRDFKAEVHPRGKSEFEVSGNDISAMTSLLLRRRLELSGLTAGCSRSTGVSSRNAYARYVGLGFPECQRMGHSAEPFLYAYLSR